MIDSKTLKTMLGRMNEALNDIDATSDSEEAEEFCAEIEDLLFYIESVDPEDEDAEDEIRDTLEQLQDMLEDAEPGIGESVKVLSNLVDMAVRNL